MSLNLLVDNDQAVSALQHALKSGEHGLKTVPGLIKRVVASQAWTQRTVRVTGETVGFKTFPEFVAALPPEGLATDVAMIRRMCADDPEALDAIDRATQLPNGKHHEAIDNINSTPDGTSAAAALRRLRKDYPDLHERVLAGELSPHAAAIEAGFRVRTATVPLTVKGVYRAALKLSQPDQDEVLRLLAERAHA